MKRLIAALVLPTLLVASASANWSFSDVSADDMTWPADHSPDHSAAYASCVAWGDVNNDGLPDLFVGSRNEPNSFLYLNVEGRLVNATEVYGVRSLTEVRSAQFIDYNQDGRLDLFCLTDNEISAELYQLTEMNRYQPVDLGLSPTGRLPVQAAVWNDFDHDGQLDLILSNGGGNGEMIGLVQSGDEFTQARAGEIPEHIQGVSTISIIDFDMDGDLDMLTGYTSRGASAHLFVDHDGVYRDELREWGIERNVGAAGVAWADFNHDGYLDFVTCGTADESYLYMGAAVNSSLGFMEVFHDPLGTESWPDMVRSATSVHVLDANQDGWTDIFYVRPDAPGNLLLVNQNGTGWEVYRGRNIQNPNGGNQACAWADMDGDGDLDVAIAQRDGGVIVYRNEIPDPCEYVALRLCNSETGSMLLDCQVIVKFEDCKQWATTSMANPTRGYNDMTRIFVNPTDRHSMELTVYVIWPDGEMSTYDIDDINLWGVTTLSPPVRIDRSDLVTVTEPPNPLVDLSSSPNPFNPKATIRFAIPEAADVRLGVYNLLGQEVALLSSGAMEAGAHVVTFDASALPSGLYIARLQAAGETRLHRMLLTK